MRHLTFIICVLALLCPASALTQASTQHVPDVKMSYWHDPSGSADPQNLEDALFRPLHNPFLDQGFVKGAVWLQLDYEIVEPQKNRLYVTLDKINFRQVDYYHFVDGDLQKSFLTGTDRPYASRDLKLPQWTFLLSQAAGRHKILIRLTTGSAMQSNIKVAPAIESVNESVKQLMYYSAVAGLFGFISILGLALTYATRRLDVLFATLVSAGALTEILSSSGLGFAYLWPTIPDLNPLAARLGIGLALGATGLFCVSFLTIKQYSPRLAATTQLVSTVLILGMLTPLPSYSIHLTLVLLCLVPILVIACAIQGYRQKVYGAGIILLGFTAFIASVLSSIAAALGITNTHVNNSLLVDAGLVLMTLLIAYGVMLRIGEQAVSSAVSDESVKAKSLFFATMSHEIRTPINGVLGMLRLLEKEQLNDTQRRYTGHARHSAELLRKIVDDILDFSKIEAGKMDIERNQFNVVSLLEETIETFAILEDNRQLEFILDASEVRTPDIVSDSAKLTQILNNLISNACKFTASGEVEVQVKVEKAQKNSKLTIKVRDTGIGIEPKKLQNLFQTFTQADQSTTRKYGGTGLGLAIVKQYCELLGGDITATSKPKVGTEFCFHIPIEVAEVKSDLPELARQSFVIFHPNPCQRLTLAAQLRAWHGDVTETGNEDSFDELCRSEKYHFAIRALPEATAGLTVTMLHTPEAASPQLIDRPPLPSKLEQALTRQQSRHEEVSANVDNKPYKLLLAEDNLINTEVALGILSDLGFDDVVTAENGQEAIEHLKSETFDLVLMDCQMPVVDGYEATQKIRAGYACDNTNIPVIAMTANAMPGDREKCLEYGMSDYIPKPIDVDKLEHTLQDWLRRA
jgi:signal transduction histidine kinase/CheY-like chemotaxis protein